MLEITIDLVPFGQRSRTKKIGYIKIWNDGTGDRFVGNYGYEIKNEAGDQICTGQHNSFNRKAGVFVLLKEILDKAI